MNFEFNIELVLSHPPSRVVVGTVSSPSVDYWTLGPSSTIGGLPIQSLALPPRALTKEGKPRFDLVAFQLTRRDHCSQFKAGQRVLVENVLGVSP